jgi:hypothetical protein
MVEPTPPRPPRPPKPSLIDIFARKNGFSKDSAGRYYHPTNGSWLQRAHGNGFDWERHSRSGEVVQYYWLKDHCLEREPLQINAEIWMLCEKSPELYSIILVDTHDNPRVISGQNLIQMRDKGSLVLYPASYRLVYKDER